MKQQIQGTIINYRTGLRTQKSKECIIYFTRAQSISDTSRFIGRKVVWQDEKDRFIGKIVALHGKKGLVRARFRKGLPGQALGKIVELVG